MNIKAQEFNIIAIVLAVVGALISWWVAGKMEATFFWKLATVVISFIACYIISAVIAEG